MMAGGSSFTDEQLAVIGVTRCKDKFGHTMYSVPCFVCGMPVHTHTFSTNRVYKCNLCKGDIVNKNKALRKAAKEQHERELAEYEGVDYEHFHRFESAVEKFGLEYYPAIEKAHTEIAKFDSVPEAMACIELLYIGVRVIVHQKVGDYTVDFCLPDEKVIVEVDGSLYHTDETKEFARDNALKHMLGDGWTVRHIPADAISKRHETFGRNMRRMLNARREELGLKPLAKPKL